MMDEHIKAVTRDDHLEWCPACKSRGITGRPRTAIETPAAEDVCKTCNGHAVVVKNRRAA